MKKPLISCVLLSLVSLFFINVQASTKQKVIYSHFDTSTNKDRFIPDPPDEGDGIIQGGLFDRLTGEPINDGETQFRATVYKQHPRFGTWQEAGSALTEQNHYQLTGLEPGNYVVKISWKLTGGETVNYNSAYQSAFWSPEGTVNCYSCEPLQTYKVTLTESEPLFQADFHLSKAAVLEVETFTFENFGFNNQDKRRTTAYSDIYTLDSLGVNRKQQIFYYYGYSAPLDNINITRAIFLLPEGDYTIYSEQDEFKGRILGVEGSCQHCEYTVRTGEGAQTTLSKNEPTYVEFELETPTGQIAGDYPDALNPFSYPSNFELYDFDGKLQSGVEIGDLYFNPDNSLHLSLFLEGIADGYYWLNFNNFDYEHEYSSGYGGNYCEAPFCDYNQLTPIRVQEGQTTLIRSQNTHPVGGSITGHIQGDLVDPNTPKGPVLPLGSSPDQHWLSIYDKNQRLIKTKYTTNPFRVNLPAGQYYLKTGHGQFGASNRYYASTLYPDIDCAGMSCDFSQGTLIEVKQNEGTDIGDIVLKEGRGIKGRVTDRTTGEGLPGIRVEVLNSENHLVSSEMTSADGYYSHWGLIPGDYYIHTVNGNHSQNNPYKIHKPYTGGYINMLYPDAACLNNQCDTNLVAPIKITTEDIDNINFSLPLSEGIKGTVTDKKTGLPLFKKRINVFKANGTQVGSYLTDHLGEFMTDAMAVSKYKILVEGGYLYLDKAVGNDNKDCLFEACELDDAIKFSPFSGPLDIQLTHKKDVLPHYTGMWFNPEEPGHGLQFEVLDQDNAAILYVTWFAHVDGEPIWLTGSGPLLGNRAFVNLIITDGQDFPDSMNPEMWGELRVKFDNLNQASLSWEPLLEGFESGELDVERLTIATIPDQDQAFYSENLNLDACVTGSFYDPERSGEGIQIIALGNPSNHLSFNWYTYIGDKQFWFTGQGDFNQDSVESLAYYTNGVNFTPDFNAHNLDTIAWGDVTIRKIPENKLEVTFTPNTAHSEFEQRTVQLIRNSSPFPMQCGYQR
jgi:hypothetical protein